MVQKKTTSLAEIIHAANNLLASIQLSSEMLLRGLDGQLNKGQTAQVKAILAQAKKMTRLFKKIKQ